MKKILTVLLTTAMMIGAPSAIFADEQTIASNAQTEDATGTVLLEASKVSSYTVKLPKTVNVSQDTTSFNIYAKGDVDGSKMVVIAEADGDHYIKDNAKLKADKKLTVTAGAGIKGADIKNDAYDETKGTTMTIVHNAIEAGTWAGELPIVIKLAAIPAE